MSNNAIYDGSPYHIVDVEGHEVELEPVEGDRDQRFRVDVMAPTLIIDPTDDQWAGARQLTRSLAALDRLEELRQQIARDYPPPDDGLTDAEWIRQERERRLDRIDEAARSGGGATAPSEKSG